MNDTGRLIQKLAMVCSSDYGVLNVTFLNGQFPRRSTARLHLIGLPRLKRFLFGPKTVSSARSTITRSEGIRNRLRTSNLSAGSTGLAAWNAPLNRRCFALS